MRHYALGETTLLQMCPVRHACPLLRAQPGYKALLRESQPARVPKMNFLIVEGDLHRGTLPVRRTIALVVADPVTQFTLPQYGRQK